MADREWKSHMQLNPGKMIYCQDVGREVKDTVPLCGGGSYYAQSYNFMTDNPDKVTCKLCIKALARAITERGKG